MMNVPIIFYAARETGDAELNRIATAHCRTTRDTIVRPDGSTAHEGTFDLATGKFLRQTTHQGLRDDSAWARGLAWSLYGYSKVFALTGSEEFLAVSERNAKYWLDHLPADKVPYWDFDADLSQPAPWGAQKETSAGAIAASGLLDLAPKQNRPTAPPPIAKRRWPCSTRFAIRNISPSTRPAGKASSSTASITPRKTSASTNRSCGANSSLSKR